jgi:hypothetical protein
MEDGDGVFDGSADHPDDLIIGNKGGVGAVTRRVDEKRASPAIELFIKGCKRRVGN